jgi:hypothetical protein
MTRSEAASWTHLGKLPGLSCTSFFFVGSFELMMLSLFHAAGIPPRHPQPSGPEKMPMCQVSPPARGFTEPPAGSCDSPQRVTHFPLCLIPTPLPKIALSGLNTCRLLLTANFGASMIAEDLVGRLPATNTTTPIGALFLTTSVSFLANLFANFPSFYPFEQLILPSPGSAATMSFPEGRPTQLVGMVSRDSGLRATGASDSTALALPTNAPTSTAAPTDFVQVLLWQRVPMGPPGGAAKRGSRDRLLP